MHSLPACPNEIGIFGNVGFREGRGTRERREKPVYKTEHQQQTQLTNEQWFQESYLYYIHRTDK